MRLAVLVLLARVLQTAAPSQPELLLPGVTNVVFEAGSVIRLPSRIAVKTLQLRLPGVDRESPLSAVLRDEPPGYSRRERRLRTRMEVDRVNGGVTLTAISPEGRGFLDFDETTLVVNRIGVTTEMLGEWNLFRAGSGVALIESSGSAAEQRAPDVMILEPPGSAFVLPRRLASLMVRGIVLTAGDVEVRIGDRSVPLKAHERGREFQTQLPFADQTEIVITATHRPSGAVRKLMLPLSIAP